MRLSLLLFLSQFVFALFFGTSVDIVKCLTLTHNPAQPYSDFYMLQSLGETSFKTMY